MNISRTLRAQRLVNLGLQLKMTALFLFMACMSALFQLFLTNRSLMVLSQDMQNDGDRLLAALPEVGATNLLMTVGILFPLMVVTGILATHRIAGPLYRMTKHMEAIARGENPGPCSLRKGDELGDVCDKLNAAIDTLRAGQQQAATSESLTEPVRGVDGELKQAA